MTIRGKKKKFRFRKFCRLYNTSRDLQGLRQLAFLQRKTLKTQSKKVLASPRTMGRQSKGIYHIPRPYLWLLSKISITVSSILLSNTGAANLTYRTSSPRWRTLKKWKRMSRTHLMMCQWFKFDGEAFFLNYLYLILSNQLRKSSRSLYTAGKAFISCEKMFRKFIKTC